MTNEQLVALIQDGYISYLGELWEQNRGLAYTVARRYLIPGGDHRRDLDDLMQAAFLGLWKAARKFDNTRGCRFSSFAPLVMRSAIRQEVGLDGRKEMLDLSVSLDELLPGAENEGATRGELLPDERLPDADAALIAEDAARVVREAVERMPREDQRQFVRGYYFEGLTAPEISRRMGLNTGQVANGLHHALRWLRRQQSLIDLEIDRSTQFYRNKGVARFQSERSSTVEDVVLRRERARDNHRPEVRRIKRSMEADQRLLDSLKQEE